MYPAFALGGAPWMRMQVYFKLQKMPKGILKISKTFWHYYYLSSNSIAILFGSFSEILQGIESKARKYGYSTLVYVTEDDPKVEKDCLNRLR